MILFLACSGSDDTSATEDSSTTATACPFDEDESASAANPLALGKTAEAYLCPEQDQDWVSVTVPSGNDLLALDLAVDAPLSAIEPTYVIYQADGETVAATPWPGAAAGSDLPLSVTHWLASGDYLMVIRDLGDDDADTRHAYTVTATGSKDADGNEPNDDSATATTNSGAMTGYVSYYGDEDWYAVSTSGSGLMNIVLQMPVGGIAPMFRVVGPDGKDEVIQKNLGGSNTATDINYYHPVEAAGTYHVVVSDVEQQRWDPATPYTLTVTVAGDPDTNEPNDFPDSATPLGTATCSGGWSSEFTRTGYLAATGDSDWYELDLSSCDQGIIELSAEFGSGLNPGLEASIRLVRAVSDNSCTDNNDCAQLLAYTCSTDLDCYGVGNACNGSGYCEGAGICLDGGVCAADMLRQEAEETSPSSVSTAAPLWGFNEVYLAVSDVGADTNDVDTSYTVRARVIDDPDNNEPNEQYTGGPPTGTDLSTHDNWAPTVDIYDCSGKKECCSSMPWTSGSLGYQYDQDWFVAPDPCPGEDCMVRAHWSIDGGGNDHSMVLYHTSSSGFQLEFQDENSNHSATSGTYGGLSGSDQCLYSYEGYDGYTLQVRDHAISGDGDDGLWDWDQSQTYSFCLEKIADGCLEPCVNDKKYGCSTP